MWLNSTKATQANKIVQNYLHSKECTWSETAMKSVCEQGWRTTYYKAYFLQEKKKTVKKSYCFQDLIFGLEPLQNGSYKLPDMPSLVFRTST